MKIYSKQHPLRRDLDFWAFTDDTAVSAKLLVLGISPGFLSLEPLAWNLETLLAEIEELYRDLPGDDE